MLRGKTLRKRNSFDPVGETRVEFILQKYKPFSESNVFNYNITIEKQIVTGTSKYKQFGDEGNSF